MKQMGLFALPLGDTVEDAVDTVITNLKLYLERVHYSDERDDYLFDFAQHSLDEARKRHAELFGDKNIDGKTT